MIYKIKDSRRKYMLEAYDKDNNLVGEAVISPFMDSDINEKPRLNIYFDITVTDAQNKIELKDQMVDEIMKRSRAINQKYTLKEVSSYLNNSEATISLLLFRNRECKC